jgi:hypothetical protein
MARTTRPLRNALEYPGLDDSFLGIIVEHQASTCPAASGALTCSMLVHSRQTDGVTIRQSDT